MNQTDFFLSGKGRDFLKKVQVNVPFPLLRQNLKRILAIGLQPEIYFSGTILDHLSPEDVEMVSAELKKQNIPVTLHAPFMDLNPGAVDERVRVVTCLRFHQVMELVPHFRPRTIVFHPGYDRWRYDNDVDLWLEKSLLTWKPLAEQAEAFSVRLALENIFEENPSILRKLFEALNSPWIGYCLDAGHGHLFSEVPLFEWVEALGYRLFEVHLHDNHRQADEHLPVGEGQIDFVKIFATLQAKNLQPIYTIEPHREESLEPSLRALENFIK